MEIAIVEWVDVQSVKDNDRGWLSKEEFDIWCNEDSIVCKSVGWLTFQNDDFIVISQTEFNGDVAENTKIPRSSIRSLIIQDQAEIQDKKVRTPTTDKYTSADDVAV